MANVFSLFLGTRYPCGWSLLWWQEFLICGCTSASENRDEVNICRFTSVLDFLSTYV